MMNGDGNMVNVLEKPGFKQAWSVVDEGLSIRTEADYNKALAMLNQLLDEVGDNESHPLYNFLEVLGTLVESYYCIPKIFEPFLSRKCNSGTAYNSSTIFEMRYYEADHVKIPDVPGREVLKYLMKEHGLSQTDLPEIGSQGVVSEILRGKRELNTPRSKF